ncbi:MAG: Flp pilus assembly protein CpaB [Rhodospirillaceae bacterium]|nr:Flp pilus assembly protein CpaB [Rhodospirillaceae bacterium]
MRSIVIGLIFVAVLLAGGTAYLLKNYLSEQEATIAAQAPKELSIKVLVAAIDLPPGTVVNNSNVTWMGWPEDGVDDEYIIEDSSEDPIGDLEKDKSVVRRIISKGEPITARRLFKQTEAGFLPGTLNPGMRAVAVKASAESASGGFILPGDRVDVVLTHPLLRAAIQRQQIDTGTNFPVMNSTTETIIENLLVLAIDQKVSEIEGGAALAGTILLEVTPKQVEILFTAKQMGSVALVLRSLEDLPNRAPGTAAGYTTDVEVSPTLSSFEAIISGQKPGAAQAPAKPTSAPAPVRRTTKSNKITVYRGAATSTGTEAQ